MIISHLHFDLQGKIILEKITFQAPMKVNRSMVNEACFLYSLKGVATVYATNQTAFTGDGHGLLMKCGKYFAETKSKTKSEIQEIIAIHFFPDILKMIFENDLPEYLNSQKTAAIFIEKVKVEGLLKNYLESLVFLFETPGLVNEGLIKLKIKELILLLIRIDSEESQVIRDMLGSLFDPVQTNLREMVEAHQYENITIEDMALLAGMSLSSFSRKFKTTYNDSPARYLRRKKLQKAQELLKSTTMRISEVAFLSGFNDLAHFTTTFTSFSRLSPKQFRLAQKNQIQK